MEGGKGHYRAGACLSIAQFFGVAEAQLYGSKSELDIVTIRSSESENQIASSTFAG